VRLCLAASRCKPTPACNGAVPTEHSALSCLRRIFFITHVERPTNNQSLAVPCHHGLMPARRCCGNCGQSTVIGAGAHSDVPPGPTTISTEETFVPRPRTLNAGSRLAIWFFWLLASMAVGGMIGAWLSGDAFTISFGIIAGGLTLTCLRLWRKGFD
jgi:hypothetical protein